MNDSRTWNRSGQFYICDDCAGDEWNVDCGCYFLTNEAQARKSLETVLIRFGRAVFDEPELMEQIAGSEIGWIVRELENKSEYLREQMEKATPVWDQIFSETYLGQDVV
jgi:hypothetical protein